MILRLRLLLFDRSPRAFLFGFSESGVFVAPLLEEVTLFSLSIINGVAPKTDPGGWNISA